MAAAGSPPCVTLAPFDGPCTARGEQMRCVNATAGVGPDEVTGRQSDGPGTHLEGANDHRPGQHLMGRMESSSYPHVP